MSLNTVIGRQRLAESRQKQRSEATDSLCTSIHPSPLREILVLHPLPLPFPIGPHPLLKSLWDLCHICVIFNKKMELKFLRGLGRVLQLEIDPEARLVEQRLVVDLVDIRTNVNGNDALQGDCQSPNDMRRCRWMQHVDQGTSCFLDVSDDVNSLLWSRNELPISNFEQVCIQQE